MTKRLYISQENTYQQAVATNYFSDRMLKTRELENSIALPCDKEKGGIYDNQSL